MRLLLDTCAFLWYISASQKLPKDLLDEIRSKDNEVWLSVVSYWEILVKHQLGKLTLPDSPSTYIPTQRMRHSIESLPLHEEAINHLSKLPLVHRDPFDRILVCQAIEHHLELVSPDPIFETYPVKTLWFS